MNRKLKEYLELLDEKEKRAEFRRMQRWVEEQDRKKVLDKAEGEKKEWPSKN